MGQKCGKKAIEKTEEVQLTAPEVEEATMEAEKVKDDQQEKAKGAMDAENQKLQEDIDGLKAQIEEKKAAGFVRESSCASSVSLSPSAGVDKEVETSKKAASQLAEKLST